jgi:hypothetical protein
MFHTTTVRSSLKLATLVPSGLNASRGIVAPWPGMRLRRWPVVVLARMIDPSSWPRAAVLPSGLRARAIAPTGIVRTGRRRAAFQTIVLSC